MKRVKYNMRYFGPRYAPKPKLIVAHLLTYDWHGPVIGIKLITRRCARAWIIRISWPISRLLIKADLRISATWKKEVLKMIA